MEIKELRFTDEDISHLTQILESCEGVKVYCDREMSGVWFHSDDWSMELRILLLMNFRLTVSRVCFIRRRQGTMTKVMNFLENYCKKHDIQELRIQSVLTKEMVGWCQKNDFSPDENAALQTGDFVIGDYRKKAGSSVLYETAGKGNTSLSV